GCQAAGRPRASSGHGSRRRPARRSTLWLVPGRGGDAGRLPVGGRRPGRRMRTLRAREELEVKEGFRHDHLLAHVRALLSWEPQVERLEGWGAELGERLVRGGRLLVAGNGGSAAQAQHLTSELVGRYRSERQPLSAIALHAET